MNARITLLPLALVSVAVFINLGAAILLKELSQYQAKSLLLISAGISAVAALNFLRFLLWGAIHRRFPLSHTYPMTALFFPTLLIVAHLYGDPIQLPQIAGTIFITVGVVVTTIGAKR